MRNQLFTVRGYPNSQNRGGVVILDAFPDDERMSKPLDANYISIGYQSDDGGKLAELGSPARVRDFIFDFYVFGVSRVWGKNLASVIRYSLESDMAINLYDPTSGEMLDYVDVENVSAQQLLVNDPRPWQDNCWVCRLRVHDNYYSSAGGN